MKKEKEIMKAKEIARQLDRQLEKLEKEQQEEPVNLCPECSFFCEQRFIDGQCK